MREVQVDELVRAMARLGALPVSLGRLAAVTGAPDFDFGEIVDVVAHDMVLAAGVLRAANSASSGAVSRIETVRGRSCDSAQRARSRAAMLAIVGGRFEGPVTVYDLDPGCLWSHSCATSIAADLVRVETKLALPSLGTTGLVHDIGKLVLDGVVAERGEPLNFGDATGVELCELERAWFGLDHGEAGAIVGSFWELPPAMIEGIRAHHGAVDDPVGASIELADTLAHALDPNGRYDELRAARLARVIGVRRDHLASILAETAERLQLLVHHFRGES